MSVAKKGKKTGRSGMFGKQHTPAAKLKIKTARDKQIFSPESLAKRRKKMRGASSNFYGVCRGAGKWRSYISPKGNQTYLGTFSTEIEAAKAYDAAAKIHYGAYAVLNFPD